MKHTLAIGLLVVLVCMSTSASAGPSESPFATFQSFKHLATPGVEAIADIDADPVRARYVLRFTEDFSKRTQAQLSAELKGVPGYRSHTWLTERDVQIQFLTPLVRVGVMQWREGRRAVVIGVMRNHGFLPRFLAGPEGCMELIPQDLAGVRDTYERACRGDTPDLRATRDHGASAAEEEFLEILRLQMRSGWNVDVGRLRVYVDRSEFDRVTTFGLLQLAMFHMVKLEHEKTLKVLDELRALAADQPSAITDAQRKLMQRMGEATFFRLIVVSVATDGLGALKFWEDYNSWSPDDFEPQLKLRLAELYRRALSPKKAVPFYMDILDLGPSNEAELLLELAHTYREAKDTIRATATVAYIRERYPAKRVPDVLSALRDQPLRKNDRKGSSRAPR